jgi:hypothetical protein
MANIIYICAFFGITAAAFGCLMVQSYISHLQYRVNLEFYKHMLKMVFSLRYLQRLIPEHMFQQKALGLSA